MAGPLGSGQRQVALLIGFGGYLLIESAFRRRLTQLLLRLTLVLAIISIVILTWTFAFQIVIGAIVALAIVVLADNLREIRR